MSGPRVQVLELVSKKYDKVEIIIVAGDPSVVGKAKPPETTIVLESS